MIESVLTKRWDIQTKNRQRIVVTKERSCAPTESYAVRVGAALITLTPEEIIELRAVVLAAIAYEFSESKS